MDNQYTLGYKAGLDAAAKVCRELPLSVIEDGILRRTLPTDCEAAIAALPVPEVQWRNLTPQEVTDAIREGAADGGWQGFAERIIAKFKEINK
jgi:hypothetical protein